MDVRKLLRKLRRSQVLYVVILLALGVPPSVILAKFVQSPGVNQGQEASPLEQVPPIF